MAVVANVLRACTVAQDMLADQMVGARFGSMRRKRTMIVEKQETCGKFH